jgi:hypothetical protein
MASSAEGGKMKLHGNPSFRSVTPNEFVPEGTLVWCERNRHNNEPITEGPFVIEEVWGPIWFGSPNQNSPNGECVKLLNTQTGHISRVHWSSFLATTYYVMNEEKLCTDVETK